MKDEIAKLLRELAQKLYAGTLTEADIARLNELAERVRAFRFY